MKHLHFLEGGGIWKLENKKNPDNDVNFGIAHSEWKTPVRELLLLLSRAFNITPIISMMWPQKLCLPLDLMQLKHANALNASVYGTPSPCCSPLEPAGLKTHCLLQGRKWFHLTNTGETLWPVFLPPLSGWRRGPAGSSAPSVKRESAGRKSSRCTAEGAPAKRTPGTPRECHPPPILHTMCI